MRKIKILSVCGSGTVSSALISRKLHEVLEEENGYSIETIEVNPSGVESKMLSEKYDLIVYTSPVYGEYNVPKLNGTSFMTGIGEDEFIEKLLEEVKKLDLG